MFIELHLLDGNEKIMINQNRIKSVYRYKGITYVYIDDVAYKVKESYEDVYNIIFYGRINADGR